MLAVRRLGFLHQTFMRSLQCVLVGFVAVTVLWARPLSSQQLPQTSVIILVDMSASFAPLTPDDRVALESAAEATLRLAAQQAEGWEHPVKFLWAVIGSASLTQSLPCGPAVQFRGIIAGRRAEREITRADTLRVWHRACVLRLMNGAVPLQQYTDISGAVALAGEVAREVPRLKILLILSDFNEDLPRGQKPTAFQLNGERVVLVYRPDVRAERRGDEVFARLADWERRLRDAGASQVCRLPVRGITGGSVEACLVR